MKIFIIFIVLLNFRAQAQDFLMEDNPKGWIRDRIGAMDIDFDIEIFDQDFFDSLGISLEYAYQVQSSYRDGFFSRVDKFKSEWNLKPGDLIPGLESPLYLNIERDSEIVFVRQFKKKWDAVKAKPYTPLRLPYNSKQALTKLVPGDFVALPATLSFVTGAETGWRAEDVFTAGAGIYYLMQGQFLVHIFRLKNDRVRLKMFATGLRQGGITGEFKTGLEIFGIELVDGLIKRLTRFEPLQFHAGLGKGGQLLLDYIFDLKDPKAAKAYDKVLSSRHRFKDLSFVLDSIRGYNIANRLHSTFVLAETIAREDSEKPKKRVEQLFKGINEFKKSFRTIKIGLPLMNYEKEKLYVRNNLVYESPSGDKSNYYFPFAVKGRKKKYLWGPIKTEEEYRRTLFGLAETDNGRNIVSYELGISTEYADDKFNEREQKRFLKYLHYQLPKSISDKIEWGKWRRGKLIRDAKLYFQITILSDALEEIKKLPWSDFKKKFKDYFTKMKELEVENTDEKFIGRSWSTMFAKKLFKAIQRTNGLAKESLDEIFKLRNKKLFYKYGIGFFMSLIPERDLDKYTSVKLDLVAPKLKGLKFRYGGVAGDELYQQLRSILAVIDNRSYDLRITTTADHFDFLNSN